MTITSTLGRLRQEHSEESELSQFKARLSYVLKIENVSKKQSQHNNKNLPGKMGHWVNGLDTKLDNLSRYFIRLKVIKKKYPNF